MLKTIWKSTSIKLNTKYILSVLLYGAESWKTTSTIELKLEVFQNKCLRRILKIFWPNTISNEDMRNRTGISPIADVIQKRRWLWLGHVLRMSTLSIPRTALRWTPQGRRDRGCPKETWRRTKDKDLKAKGLTINTALKFAEDRAKWKSLAIASRAKRRRDY